MKKQNLKRIITTGLIAGSILAIFPLSASAEWKNDRTGWWYAEGNTWAVGWRLVDGQWYYFDNSGYMKTGWINYKNKWYYLYNSGVMAKNTTINGYALDAEGAWIEEKQNASSSNNVNTSSSNKVLGKNLDQAVGAAIKAKGEEGYLRGEAVTEGHIILDTEEKDNLVKAYTISSFGYFGFENSIFTKISGSGAIPTVITFSKNAAGEYTLVDYKEPSDGDENMASIKKMFPERLWGKVLSDDNTYYSELSKSQETQAKEYLHQIGRDSKVSVEYVEKKLPNINVAASNKLFSELTKEDDFLNNCTYWIGTKEQLENGNRVIYETAQSRTSDGYDLITFKKTKADGIVIEERSYKIVGSEPVRQ